MPKPTGSSEHEEQCVFFEYTRLKAETDSKYSMIFAVPNGGFRHKATARKLKKEGVEKGVPDVMVAIPTDKFPGMFLEMKYGYNKPSEHQKQWLERLEEQGYYTKVCWSGEEAIAALEAYLEGMV